MSNFTVSNRSKILAIIYFLSGLFFLAQVFLSLEIVPVKLIASFFGLPNNGMRVLLFGMIIIPFLYIVMANMILKFLEKRIPQKRVSLRRIRLSQSINGAFAFLNTWITAFSFGIMAMIKILPEYISYVQLINLYIFWFLIFKAISKVVKVKFTLAD